MGESSGDESSGDESSGDESIGDESVTCPTSISWGMTTVAPPAKGKLAHMIVAASRTFFVVSFVMGGPLKSISFCLKPGGN